MKHCLLPLVVLVALVSAGCGGSQDKKNTPDSSPIDVPDQKDVEKIANAETMTFIKTKDLTRTEEYNYYKKKMNCDIPTKDFDPRLLKGDIYVYEDLTNSLMKSVSHFEILSKLPKMVKYKWDMQKTTLASQKVENISLIYTSEFDEKGDFKSGQRAIRIGLGKDLKAGCRLRTDAPDSKRRKETPSTYELGFWKMKDGQVLEVVRETTFEPMTEICDKSQRDARRTRTSVWSTAIVRRSGYCLPEDLYSRLAIETKDGELLDDVQYRLISAPVR